jgi:hypothetical protein
MPRSTRDHLSKMGLARHIISYTCYRLDAKMCIDFFEFYLRLLPIAIHQTAFDNMLCSDMMNLISRLTTNPTTMNSRNTKEK